MKNELLFYQAYEAFYAMAAESEAFAAFCRDAYGADFSQDGFSDVHQVARFVRAIPVKAGLRILDVGCGNGKMLRYLRERTGASVAGFDYAGNAIRSARAICGEEADVRVGVIGEIEYPPEQFDAVTAMDSLYFAPDMEVFVGQIRCWLKPDGVLCAGYQEGDMMPRTRDADSTVLACALRANRMRYDVEDITAETYRLMRRKREAALRHQDALMAEGQREWFELLMAQTEHCLVPEAEYRARNARYIYIAHKEEA